MIEQNDDQDLDDLPRRRVDSDQDLSPVRRRSPSLKEPRKRSDNDGDISPGSFLDEKLFHLSSKI